MRRRRPAPTGTDSARNSPAVTGEPTVNANAAPPRPASGSARAGFAADVAAQRRIAGATFRKTVALGRSARRGEQVTLTIRTAAGGIVSRSRVSVAAGQRRLRLRAQITAVRGTYRYDARFGGRKVAAGRFAVAGKAGAGAQLAANRTLVCRIIR